MVLKLMKNEQQAKAKTLVAEKAKFVTHLYYHDKYLTNIRNIPSYKHLTTLYLHNNLITTIEKLDGLVNLSNLYLQRNNIKKIQNLDTLTQLKKLYLGQNEISVVENLQKLINLEELYIEKQNLSNGDSLCFDPRSIDGLANKLQILNIASNNIYSINILRPLKYVKQINVANNSLVDINDVCGCIENWYYLKEAWFAGNPIAKGHRYRENLIGSSTRLEILDNKQISETTRCFIKRFEREKATRGSKQSVNINNEIASLNLPKNYPPPIQESVYKYILHPKNEESSGDQLYTDYKEFVPWNSLPQTKKKMPLMMQKQRKPARKSKRISSADAMFPNMFK